MPSATPSKYPTTSAPTQDGETNEPSNYPTSGPTVDFNYLTHYTYRDYLRLRTKYNAVPDSYTYGTYYFKGLSVGPTCSDWNSYTTNTLQLPFDNVAFSKLTLDVVIFDFVANVHKNVTAECKDATAIKQIVSNMQNKGTFDINCEQRQWRVFPCNGRSVVCVNCKQNCVATEACPGLNFGVYPCNTCKYRAAVSTYFNAQYTVRSLYPLIRALPTIIPQRTSASISVNVSAAGNIYCAAFLPGTIISTVLDIRKAGVALLVNGKGVYPLTLPNLSPYSTYNAYCYTEDFAAHVMPLAEALITSRTPFTTLCCRALEVLTAPSKISQYIAGSGRTESLFSFQLSSRPVSGPVSVLSKLVSTSCTDGSLVSSTVTDGSVLPSTFVFSTSATSLIGNFYVRTPTTGCYRVTLRTSGIDVYDGANFTFQAMNVRINPDVPVLTSVQLSNAGSRLLFNFDSATDRGSGVISSFFSSFACSLIVSFPGSASSTCSWVNTTQLAAVPSSGTSLPNIGTSASVLANVVRAACVTTSCASYTPVALTSLPILAPANPLRPNAVLAAPSSVGYCSDIRIDPTYSTGTGRRAWKSVVWTVTPASALINNTDALSAYLNNMYKDTRTIVIIPNNLLIRSTYWVDSTYVFVLTLTNFLDQTSRAAVTIMVKNDRQDITPNVVLSGTREIVYRRNAVNVYAAITWPGCASNATRNLPVTVSWKVYNGLVYVASLQSTSADKRYFRLPAYSLEAATNYTISATASVDVGAPTLLSGVVSGPLQTGRSGVVASIVGASTRTVSASQSALLDASTSTDLDYPAARLNYTWSCVQFAPLFGAPCEDFVSLRSNLATLSIPATFLLPATYTFTVVATNAAKQFSTASVRLIVIATSVPSFSLASSKVKYNPDEKIVLTASLSATTAPLLATWSSDSIPNFATSGTAQSPLQRTIPVGESNFYQISIGANRLVAGLSYNFALSVRFVSSATTATNTITIFMNSPPAGGYIAASPTQGTALSTSFLVATGQWSDEPDDYPLSYVISTYAATSSQLTVLKSLDGVPYVISRLGQGLQSQNFQLTCLVIVSDSYGSMANATSSVRVLPIASTSTVVATTTTALTLAVGDANPTVVNQVVGTALASVNSVDCTVPAPCGSINRALCSQTAGHCGPCLAGFIGPAGDSNIPCNSSSAIIPIGQPCSARGVCVTGACSAAGICMDVSKTCPANCGSRGQCMFTDLEGNRVETCNTLDTTCRAECLCNFNRFGASCILTQFDYNQLVLLRTDLCTSLYQTLNLQNVTSDIVKSRATMINDILVDNNLISTTALSNCSAALTETILAHPEMACEEVTLQIVGSALSRILYRGTALPRSVLGKVTAAVNALSQGCQTTAVVGEKTIVVTAENLRISTRIFDASDGAKYDISVPVSDFEAFNGVTRSKVSLNSTNLNYANTVGAVVFQFNNNPRGVKSNSTSVNLQTVMYSQRRDSRRRLNVDSLSGATIVLLNKEPIQYPYVLPVTQSVRCFEYRDVEYRVNVTCANGLVIHRTCPIRAKGVYNITCPGYQVEPKCTTFNGVDFAVDPSCSVVDYTTHNTTCYCTGELARRYLQSNDEFTVVEYSSLFQVVGTDVATTFISAPSITDVRRNAVILSVLAGVVGIFFVGLIGLCFWDRTNSRKPKKLRKESPVKYRLITEFYEKIFPVELRRGPWYSVLWHNMLLEHPWVSLLADSTESNQRSRPMKWTIAFGQMLNFLFANCIIASLLYPDDGYCEDINVDTDCKSAMTTGGFFHACKWRESNETCEFQPPDINFDTTIVLTIIAAMLAIPFDQVLEYTAKKITQYFHHRSLSTSHNAKIVPEGEEVETRRLTLQPRFDEFALAQTPHSTLFRAARLEKARLVMDFVLPEEEAELVLARAQAEKIRWENNKLYRNASDYNIFHLFHYSFRTFSTRAVTRKVTHARDRAVELKKEVDLIQDSEEKETFMMRHFIVDHFKGHQKNIVAKYFLRDYNFRRTENTIYVEYFSLVFLPVMFAVIIYYIYVFNLSIGSRATNMWLLVVSINFLQDVFFVVPLKIWINYVIVNGNVSTDVRELCERLCARSKVILMRTHGMMRDADALVQHFNPACRTARMVPELPIARLLLTLNDHDVPLRKRFSVFFLPYAFFTFGVLSLALLPEVLQETGLDVLSNALMDFGCIGFQRLGVASTAGLVVVLVVLFVGIILWEWRKFNFQLPNTQVAVTDNEKKKAESIFNSLEDEHNAPIRSVKKPRIVTAKATKGRYQGLSDLHAVQTKALEVYGDDEDEAVVNSELIDYDDFDDARAHPDASKQYTEEGMGSINALQAFKRPAASKEIAVRSVPVRVSLPPEQAEAESLQYSTSLRQVPVNQFRSQFAAAEAEDHSRINMLNSESARWLAVTSGMPLRDINGENKDDREVGDAEIRARRDSVSSQLSEVGFPRTLMPVSGPPLSSSVDRIFGTPKSGADNRSANRPLSRPTSGVPKPPSLNVLRPTQLGGIVEESKQGTGVDDSEVQNFQQTWKPPSEVLNNKSSFRIVPPGQFTAVTQLPPIDTDMRHNRSTGRMRRHRPSSAASHDSASTKASDHGPGFSQGINARVTPAHYTDGLGPGGQASQLRDTRLNTSTMLLNMREGRATSPVAGAPPASYIHALTEKTEVPDAYAPAGPMGFHGPDDDASLRSGASRRLGATATGPSPRAHSRSTPRGARIGGGGNSGPGALAAGPGSSLHDLAGSPNGNRKARKHPMLYLG